MSLVVQLIRPTGGETLQVGMPFDIQWTSAGASKQRVQYSLDDGNSFSLLQGALGPDVMQYLWTVPAGLVPAGQASIAALIRIVVVDDSQNKVDATSGPITIAAPPALAITSVTPSHGPLGGGTMLTIQGASFDSSCNVKVGGVDATQVNVASGGASLTAVTPPGAAAGLVDVKVKNPAVPGVTVPGAFQYDPPAAATITSVTPSHGPLTGGTTLTILGSGFDPACKVKIADVDATQVNVAFGGASLTAVTPPGAAAGSFDVKVKNPNVPAVVDPGAFQYDPPAAATITSVTPSHGPLTGGTTLTILGSGFDPACKVKIADVDATQVNVAFGGASLTAVTPPGAAAGSFDVKVKNPNVPAVVDPGAFRYDPPAAATTITSVTPSHGPLTGGTTLTVLGSGFDPACKVKIADVDATQVNVAFGGASLTAVTPPGAAAGSFDVKVKNPNVPAVVDPGAFQYDPPAAATTTITSVTPGHGPLTGGTTLTILGSGFDPACKVKIADVDATQVNVAFGGASLTAVSPLGAAAGSFDVKVKNPNVPAVVDPGAFQYDPPAAATTTITSVTPSHGPLTGGTTLTILGSGFDPACKVKIADVDATQVNVAFGGASLTAVTPPGAGAGSFDVKVKNPNAPAVVDAGAFRYDPPIAATITSVTPDHGTTAGGTTVTILGTGFDPSCNVQVGDVDALHVKVADATRLTADTPPRARADRVDVKVKNPGAMAVTAVGAFQYQGPGGLALGSVTPLHGPLGGGTTLVLLGQGFVQGVGVAIGGTPAASVTFVSATELHAVTPARPTADLVLVRVKNPDQSVSALPFAFQYDPLPVVLAVSPDAGPAAQDPSSPRIVTLQGLHFQQPAGPPPAAQLAVTFGGAPSPAVTFVDAGTLKAVVPATQARGAVTVEVHNPDGGKGKLGAGFTYLGPQAATQARVSRVEPITVLEDTPSKLTIKGRNLIDALHNGLLALRAPARVTFARLTDIAETSDKVTQEDTLELQIKVVASPPLDPGERVVVQIIGSRRPKDHIKKDRLVSTSSVTFNVLPRSAPVAIAFNASVPRGAPGMVVVAGANLAGATLRLDHAGGSAVTLSHPKSSDRVVAATVHVDPAFADPVNLVLLQGDKQVGSYPLALEAPTPEDAPFRTPADPQLKLKPAPGQKLIAPTRADSKAFDLFTQESTDGTVRLDSGSIIPGITIQVATFNLVLPLLDERVLLPFFDGGGQELVDKARLAAVGRIFGDRAVTLLFVLRVDLTISVDVELFIGVNPFSDFVTSDPFNELAAQTQQPGSPFGDVFGSIVTEIRVRTTFDLALRFSIAVAYPAGFPPDNRMVLRTIASLALDLMITVDGRGSRLDVGAGVSLRVMLGPKRIRPLPIRGQYGFALSLLSDQAYRDPLDLGLFGYFFPSQEGDYCLDWDFDVQLFEERDGAAPVMLEGEFFPESCLTVRHNDALRTLRIEPPALSFTQGGEAQDILAFATPVDEAGKVTGKEIKLAPSEVTFERDPGSPDALDPVFQVVPPDPKNPLAEWQVMSTKVGGGVVQAVVPTAGAPGRGVLPADVLGFALFGLLSDDEGAPVNEPGGKRGKGAITKKARVDIGCKTRLSILAFDCRQPSPESPKSIASEAGGIRLLRQADSFGPPGTPIAPAGGPDRLLLAYDSLAKNPKGKFFVQRIQPDQLTIRSGDDARDPAVFTASAGTGCQAIRGAIVLFTVPDDAPRPLVPQGGKLVKLDDFFGLVPGTNIGGLRFDSLPEPPLDLLPFTKCESYRVSLVADYNVKNGTLSTGVDLPVFDGDLTEACYLLGARKANIDFYGSLKLDRVTFRQFAGLLGFNGVRVLFDLYHQAASSDLALFRNPVWTAALSAVLAEQFYLNFVRGTQDTRTPKWKTFFSMNDLDVSFHVLGAADLVYLFDLGVAFGDAHLGDGLPIAIRSANALLGHNPCCGPDLVQVATTLVAAQSGIVEAIATIDSSVSNAAVKILAPVAALLFGIRGTPTQNFRRQIRKQFVDGLVNAGEPGCADYFASHFK